MPVTAKEAERNVARPEDVPLVNDVVIKMATANGSGSQSANQILMRAIFQMGIPVGAKNRFPSNIEGLPTWFTIRANEDGWLADRTTTDVLVAMNPHSVVEDIERLRPNAILVLPDTLKGFLTRDDVVPYLVPFSKLVKEVCPDSKLRKKMVNVVYVGVVAWILGIEMDEIFAAIDHQFQGKEKAIEMNREAATAGFDWASENLEPQSMFRLQRSSRTEGKILIDGNDATAVGLLFGGVTVLAWYPITPSSSVCETLIRLLHAHRRDPVTGRTTYAVVQAEDEIASIGTVLGAGWAGARACTATSGPGMSLMAEMAGLSYFAEVPAVIVNVQRMGPSTGLPTRTAQSDIASAYQLSHGDCKHPLLIPGNMKECYEFALESLDLAEQLQTLVLVMSDLDLGMNQWMSEPFEPPTKPMARGKVLSAEDVAQLEGFGRYRDVDGDGIPYRTLPGTNDPRAAYFTRGTGHDTEAGYSEKSTNWEDNMDRLKRKFETARAMLPGPIVKDVDGASTGLIAYGSSDPAAEEARHILADTHGIDASYLRIRALPVNHEVTDFIARHKTVYLIEQNRDAQMATILRGEFPELAAGLRSVLHYNGRSIDADTIVEQILQQEAQKDLQRPIY